MRVVSAHRPPEAIVRYDKTAVASRLSVTIVGALSAANSSGMFASRTPSPVLGVSVESKT